MACWHVLCGAGQNAISSICFLMGLSTALVTSIASKSLKSLRDGLNLTDRIHVHQEHEENSEIHQKLGVWIGVLLSCVASESSSRRQESRAPLWHSWLENQGDFPLCQGQERNCTLSGSLLLNGLDNFHLLTSSIESQLCFLFLFTPI